VAYSGIMFMLSFTEIGHLVQKVDTPKDKLYLICFWFHIPAPMPRLLGLKPVCISLHEIPLAFFSEKMKHPSWSL
jgi:hypothetical protein